MTIWQRIKRVFARLRPAPIGMTHQKLPNGRTAVVDDKGNFVGFK